LSTTHRYTNIYIDVSVNGRSKSGSKDIAGSRAWKEVYSWSEHIERLEHSCGAVGIMTVISHTKGSKCQTELRHHMTGSEVLSTIHMLTP